MLFFKCYYTYQQHTNSHPNGTWNEKTGYGMVNAGKAVRMAIHQHGVGDLYVKDNPQDYGDEPNTTTSNFTNAPEIRLVQSGHDVLSVRAGETYDVRIIVRNADTRPTPAGKKVHLNWARISNNMPWNSAWDQPLVPLAGALGGYIGYCELPLIYAGGSYEASITWTVPMANNVMPSIFNEFTWGCSLLARVSDGYVTGGESFSNYDITTFVANSNNVARKNITILQENYLPIVGALEYPSSDEIENPIRIQYASSPNASGRHLTSAASVYLQFDEDLTHAWEQTGIIPSGCTYKGKGLFVISDTIVNFDGLRIDTSKTYYFSTYAKFNEALPVEDASLPFDIKQYILTQNDTIFSGSIGFTAVYDEDAYMKVYAYENKIAMPGDNIQFTAACAAPDAEYIWYSANGDTIGTGDELNLSATTTQKFFLVGRSELEEAVGYDSVTLSVRPGMITSISPNPASEQAIVGYRLIEGATNATIAIANSNGQVIYTAILDETQVSHTINLPSVPTGLYSVRLEVQGALTDSHTLVVY